MQRKKRIGFFLAAIVLLSLLIGGGVIWSRRNLKTVQTARVRRQNLVSIVTASGEIKPKDSVHVSANAFGRIVAIYVNEGDLVRKGQLLARLEAIQPAADVRAQEAQLAAAETDVQGAEASVQSMQANVKTAQATLERAQAQRERAEQDFSRTRSLHEDQLISRAVFEQAQADYTVAVATVKEAEARSAQAEAQLKQAMSQAEVARERVRQAKANLERLHDVLAKHTFVSPLDGVVTDLPVNVGETVVLGVQNMPGSLLMTIADLSVITTEVLVDETDIARIRLGQPAQIRVDALPNQPFAGQVTEIGNTAVVRSTGLAAGQSTTSSQQAKDFKVVVTLVNPHPNLRPGLSATAEIVTATREKALAVPLQSLTIRSSRELEGQRQNGTTQAAPSELAPAGRYTDELEGVFVIRGREAFFQPVGTGISGISEIELLKGVEEGEEIITGSYEALRTLKSGERVRIDNAAAGEKILSF